MCGWQQGMRFFAETGCENLCKQRNMKRLALSLKVIKFSAKIFCGGKTHTLINGCSITIFPMQIGSSRIKNEMDFLLRCSKTKLIYSSIVDDFSCTMEKMYKEEQSTCKRIIQDQQWMDIAIFLIK